jgi:hypothetical protein
MQNVCNRICLTKSFWFFYAPKKILGEHIVVGLSGRMYVIPNSCPAHNFIIWSRILHLFHRNDHHIEPTVAHNIWVVFTLWTLLWHNSDTTRVVKVVDFKPLAPHRCGCVSWQRLWILSCEEAIQLAYGTAVVLLRRPLVPEVMHRKAPEVFLHQ